MEECFKDDPLARLEDERREVEESLETKDKFEPLGLMAVLCDVK